jgi:hypothetical protein
LKRAQLELSVIESQLRLRGLNVAQDHSLRGFALQHIELVSENKDFGFQRSPRPEQSDQGAPDQPANVAHRTEVSTDSRAPVSHFGFTVGTGLTGRRAFALGDDTLEAELAGMLKDCRAIVFDVLVEL